MSPGKSRVAEPSERPPAEPPDYVTFDFSRGDLWYRIHRIEHKPFWFGPGKGKVRDLAAMWRFDDPGPGATHPEARSPSRKAMPDKRHFGVCYLGTTAEASFVETFLRRSGVPGRKDVGMKELESRQITTIVLTRDIRVVDLRGEGLSRAHLDSMIFATRDYTLPQVVARTLWRHPAKYDGIACRTRHDPGKTAIALFDRARDSLHVKTTEMLAADLPRLLRWRDSYGFRLIF